MTGYGKGEAVAGSRKFTVEIRSLNSKSLDLSIRIPPSYRRSEYDLRNMASKSLQRGKVDIYVNCETSCETSVSEIDVKLFNEYYKQFSKLALPNWGTPVTDAIALAIIARMPDVISGETPEATDEEAGALKEAMEEAVVAINTFREQEGAILMADLLRRVDRIEGLKESVTPYEKGRIETVRSRIRENIEAIGITVDSNRLEQEMIFYVEKFDITEEKVRLTNHCRYFREVAAAEEGAGRKLGFITQEMGREINTLGSKANDATIQKIVVEMKDELEKIKEQLLNIL